MSTHLLGFQSFFRFLHHFALSKLVTRSIKVKGLIKRGCFLSSQVVEAVTSVWYSLYRH